MTSANRRRYRGTTFGGPNDLWDMAYHPGRLYALRPGESPASYYARLPAFMKRLFRPEMATAETFPVKTLYTYKAGDHKNKVTRTMRVGLSWWLDSDNVDYFAWHQAHQVLRSMALQGRAWLRVTNDQGVTVEGPIIDHGPSGGMNDLVDMSPSAHRKLSCDGTTKNIVSVELFYT